MSEKIRHFLRREATPEDREIKEKPLSSSIEIDKPEKGQQLSVKTDDGELCLNDYVSKEVVFDGKPGGISQFSYSVVGTPGHPYIEHLLQFDSEKVNELSGRLLLLHEMGHALDELRPDYEEQDDRLTIRGILYETLGKIQRTEEYEKTPDADKARYVSEQFKTTWKTEAKEWKMYVPRLRYKDVLENIEALVREERQAWANGLKLNRTIQKEKGIDLLEGASFDEIFATIRNRLGSYEDGFAAFLDDAEGRTFMDWLKEKFNG